MTKPNIIISKCLNFDNCRFNGDKISDDFLLRLGEFVNYIPVCPEVAIGLSTPRMPLRVFKQDSINRLTQPGTKSDLTDAMNSFAKKFLEKQQNIDGFIMKNRSPSCGIADVKLYAKQDAPYATEGKTSGLFSAHIDEYFLNTPKEDEGRLKNFRLREEFLTKIFTLCEFREIRKGKQISKLVNFQAKNKYLFMLYSPKIQKELGVIIAGYDKTNLEDLYNRYYIKLGELFYVNTKISKMVNVLSHISGYFKNTSSEQEKTFFQESLEIYKEGRIPTSSIIHIIKSWALRDNQEYILAQTILQPYPKELIELSDSGKILKL